MTLYEGTVLTAIGIILALAVWVPLRRWSARGGGSFADVPDAPRDAERVDAPGAAAPYSSFDPWAPPKEPVDWSRKD